MSATQYNPKTEPNNGLYDSTPPQLKINKDSFFIKKSSSSSPPPPSSSSSSSLNGNLTTATSTKPQPRQPVIIYTHSPKIIHTHPRDFMALVQKLTGYSRSDDDPAPNPNGNNSSSSQGNMNDHKSTINRGLINNNDQDSESTNSVITDENGSCMGDPQVNSCFVPPPIFDPTNPCFNNIPFFATSNTDFLCSTATTTTTNSSLYNYADSLFLMPNNIRSSMSSSSSSLEGMKDFPDI